jgi:DNA-directed RNA polymerase subunit beta'
MLKLKKNLQKILFQLEKLYSSFDYIKINLASPVRIKSWSEKILPNGEIIGEVLMSSTINKETLEPDLNGLFCEKIFGPVLSWHCKCGKYTGFMYNKVCEICLIEITDNRVRRYRMGYIDLKYPIIHFWYLNCKPNYICHLIQTIEKKFNNSDLKNIIYFKNKKYFFNNFKFCLTRLKNELSPFFSNKNDNKIKLVGTEIIKAILENIDLQGEIKKLRFELNFKLLLKNFIQNPNTELFKKIRILESFLFSNTNPSWMILTTLPVLPPELRPLYELENGNLISSDLNELYKIVIEKNQQYFTILTYYSYYTIYINQFRKSLQESTEALFDNARLPVEKKIILNNTVVKSLTELLEGKEGHFRQLLLGKRVDYSGRSIIIVGPHLRLNQCGLPYGMIKEIFKPFLINELFNNKNFNNNLKLAELTITNNKPFIWTLLIKLTKKYNVLLNRAPTLHRYSIQAFNPILTLGKYITLHPLLCTGFNADFDGDQMAVHLPISEASQFEIASMMRASFNILSNSNGDTIIKPTQDIIIGCYYLTLMINQNKTFIKRWFSNETQVLVEFFKKKLTIHTPILVRYSTNKINFLIKNNLLIFEKEFNNFKEIIIYSTFKKTNSLEYYFITSIGIIMADTYKKNIYKLNFLFLETTPGRLLFNINYKNALKNYVYK